MTTLHDSPPNSLNDSLHDSLFLRALRRQPVERTPVWLMRQAGRYLPEYRRVRKQAGSFLKLAKNPELACEVTLQPIHRFGFDAAILFSDILMIPDAMGLGLHFATGEGPMFSRPVRSQKDIEQLPIPDPESDLGYVTQAIKKIRAELPEHTPLIGFCGSPWTVATYAVEGRSSRNLEVCKSLIYQQPAVLHELLLKLANASIDYLHAQVRAGVQALMIFDTWGSALSTAAYKQFSLAYMRHIVAALKGHPETKSTPVILFTKGGGLWLEAMADTGCDAIGIDWTCALDNARQRIGSRVAIQGNLDPGVLYGDRKHIQREVHALLDQYGAHNGHIFNLGHGIHPGIDPANVQALVSAIHSYQRTDTTRDQE